MTWTPNDAEIRRNALALHKAWRAAEEAYNASDEDEGHDVPQEAHDEIRAADAAYYEKQSAMRKEHQARCDEIMKKYAKGPTPLKAAMDQAEIAYEQADGPALLEDDDGNAVICAKTGLPIWDDEPVLSDAYEGEFVIRAATGLPPRAEDGEVEEAA